MKKSGFVLQVMFLLAALPVLTILEMNHGTAQPVTRKALEYTLVAGDDNNTCVTIASTPLFK